MSDTLTSDELDIEFVLWEAEDPWERPCESQQTDCPNAALYRMLWVPSQEAQARGFAGCRCGPTLLCLGHKDWVLAQETPEDMDFFYCKDCKGFCDLKGIEPIRGKA